MQEKRLKSKKQVEQQEEQGEGKFEEKNPLYDTSTDDEEEENEEPKGKFGVDPGQKNIVNKGEDLGFHHNSNEHHNGISTEAEEEAPMPATGVDPEPGSKIDAETQHPGSSATGLDHGSESKLDPKTHHPSSSAIDLDPGSGLKFKTETERPISRSSTEASSDSTDSGNQEVYLGNEAWKENPFDVTLESTKAIAEGNKHLKSMTNTAAEKLAKEVLSFLINLKTEDIIHQFEEFLQYHQHIISSQETSHQIADPEIHRQVEQFKRNEKDTACCRIEAFLLHYTMASYINTLSKKDKGTVYEAYVRAEFVSESEFLKIKQSPKAFEAMKSSWKRKKDIGEKLSKLVGVFGQGIFLTFPASKCINKVRY